MRRTERSVPELAKGPSPSGAYCGGYGLGHAGVDISTQDLQNWAGLGKSECLGPYQTAKFDTVINSTLVYPFIDKIGDVRGSVRMLGRRWVKWTKYALLTRGDTTYSPAPLTQRSLAKAMGEITYACSSGNDTSLERGRQRLNFWRFCSVDSRYASYLWERTIATTLFLLE